MKSDKKETNTRKRKLLLIPLILAIVLIMAGVLWPDSNKKGFKTKKGKIDVDYSIKFDSRKYTNSSDYNALALNEFSKFYEKNNGNVKSTIPYEQFLEKRSGCKGEVTSDGNYYAFSSKCSNDKKGDVKVSYAINSVSNKDIYDSGDEYHNKSGYNYYKLSDGFVLGSYVELNSSEESEEEEEVETNDYYIIKYNNKGIKLWEKTFSENNSALNTNEIDYFEYDFYGAINNEKYTLLLFSYSVSFTDENKGVIDKTIYYKVDNNGKVVEKKEFNYYLASSYVNDNKIYFITPDSGDGITEFFEMNPDGKITSIFKNDDIYNVDNILHKNGKTVGISFSEEESSQNSEDEEESYLYAKDLIIFDSKISLPRVIDISKYKIYEYYNVEIDYINDKIILVVDKYDTEDNFVGIVIYFFDLKGNLLKEENIDGNEDEYVNLIGLTESNGKINLAYYKDNDKKSNTFYNYIYDVTYDDKLSKKEDNYYAYKNTLFLIYGNKKYSFYPVTLNGENKIVTAIYE